MTQISRRGERCQSGYISFREGDRVGESINSRYEGKLLRAVVERPPGAETLGAGRVHIHDVA